ncbi:MAG: hypothetical protein ACP5SH_27385 [Syntrophobacteraceae bacterium]
MKIQDTSVPVVILCCQLGGLAIMRSLGRMGVTVYAVDADLSAPAMTSRYCRERFPRDLDEERPGEFLDYLVGIGKKIGRPSILIPTSDETALFVARYSEELSRYFIFPRNEFALVESLASKKEMFKTASKWSIPTACTLFPEMFEEVEPLARSLTFPVVLKGIYGNRLQGRTGKKMQIVHSCEELIEKYKLLEDPQNPNLMIQEYIPGADDQVYLFNGYFNRESECLSALTGRKIRQFPPHFGAACLAVCETNRAVADVTTKFIKAIGYRGVVDVEYRLDPRDGLYKVLDINPRVGQLFRLFATHDDMDLIKLSYLDLTGQNVPTIMPKEGRRWVIEDADLMSSFDCWRKDTLGFAEWIRSVKDVKECAWFDFTDPAPFLGAFRRLLKTVVLGSPKHLVPPKDERTGPGMKARHVNSKIYPIAERIGDVAQESSPFLRMHMQEV